MLCLSRFTELGIKSSSDMVNIAKSESLSKRGHAMQMHPVGRARCLKALMAEITATPPPESLRRSNNMQELVDTKAEYRRILEGVAQAQAARLDKLCPAAFRRR